MFTAAHERHYIPYSVGQHKLIRVCTQRLARVSQTVVIEKKKLSELIMLKQNKLYSRFTIHIYEGYLVPEIFLPM